MKKLLLSGALIAAFIGYILNQRPGNAGSSLLPPSGYVQNGQSATAIDSPLASGTPSPTTPSSSSTPSPSPLPTQVNSPVATASPTPTASQPVVAGFKDGQYTGASADAYYGNVQVQVVISGGKITDVKFLDYPSDRQRSQMINSQAMPYLKYEAIKAQSANVDIVSGATATSQAFQQSLASALSQAV